jgi:PilZ domain
VQPEHPRAPRLPFVAPIELTDVSSETQMRERTSSLRLFGCRVNTLKPLPTGTKVRIRIEHERGEPNLVALGKVVYSLPHSGMGVVFTKIEPNSQVILEKWITELRVRK